MKHVLVITDNGLQYGRFRAIAERVCPTDAFDYRRSFRSRRAKMYEGCIDNLPEINVKEQWRDIVRDYDCVISMHCKQIFPRELVEAVRCVNVHPGYNPLNRGWYPQVFAIANGTVIGATIHEMDSGIDAGRIIDRMTVEVFADDTSKEVYERVLEAEMKLVEKNLPMIVQGSYASFPPEEEGVYHSRQDYEAFCRLDLDEKMTMGQALNRLRALSHGSYRNAWFEVSGRKVYVSLSFSR